VFPLMEDPNTFREFSIVVRQAVGMSDGWFGSGQNTQEFVQGDDVRAIATAAELHFPMEHTFSFYSMMSWLTSMATRLIDAHGDTGHGNKPEDMNRFTYWIQHLDFEEVQSQADRIRSMALVEVFQTTKKSKCSVCKEGIQRGEVMVCISEREDVRRPPSNDITGRQSNKRHFCTKSECMNQARFPGLSRNAPVVDSVPEGGGADVATELRAIQRSLRPYPNFRPIASD
jgi:hypothetical protein